MSEIMTVNQRTQVGVESTHGTSVAATKMLECFTFDYAPNADNKLFRPSGHKYSTEQEENMEWMDVTLGGNLDYNGIVYPLSGVAGAATIGAHGTSATAKDWTWTPPVIGSVDPKTFTHEWGDSVRARKLTYGLYTSFGYKLTRKDVSVSGKMIGRALSDGITMTSSPTAIALAPVVGKHWNVYMDATSGALGTTLLTRIFSAEFLFDGLYGPFYALNRADISFSGHADMPPKATLKLLMMSDSTGMAPLTNMQAGTTLYVRLQAQGAQIASDGPGAVYNTIQHDMALKVSKPNPFTDEQGLYCAPWEFEIVEDPTWNTGQAHVITATNLLTAL